MDILIADDEHLIRQSIRYNLEKLNIPELRIEEATDGLDMLRLLEVLQPDVAFVDIKMPRLSGLDAIEQGMKTSPQTEFVILTGFSEFDYARKAVALRINEYLLKPASFEQLQTVMHNIELLLARRAAERNRLFSLQIAEMIAATATVAGEPLPPDGMNCQLAAVSFDGIQGTNRLASEDWLEQARLCAAPFMSRHVHMAVLKPRDNEWLLVFGSRPAGDAGNDKLSACLSEIRNMTAAWRQKQGAAAVTWVSGRMVPIRLFTTAYEELLKLTCLRALLGTAAEYSQSFLEVIVRDKPDYLPVSKLLVELTRCHAAQSYVEFNRVAENLFSLAEAGQMHSNPQAIRAASLFLRSTLGIFAQPDAGYSRFKNELLDFCRRLLGSQTERSQLIRSIVAYANTYYTEDISVAKVADLFGISPNYLSALFHKETGSRFVEYVSDLRMKEAKRLLMESDLSVHDVTRKVGFYSTSHFSKLFAKHYGISPQEYKKM
ncbi:response regulator transcription factor [Paenibacillus thalictri]|uniref:Helix-turn-helix domain-containing protein n=1 Tax=Paenibacillus thalictri TaxID=2527873 RepID=A0A4Q9DW86_9BACL|nr:helix-turn-helix domain-containing protein [Paenibacillus thalictri]TBL80656.1 helix-turn-helix domain-containing protein [Paenibacillus thalictri]